MPNYRKASCRLGSDSKGVSSDATPGPRELTRPGFGGRQIEAEESFRLTLCSGRDHRARVQSLLQFRAVEIQNLEGDIRAYQGEPERPAPTPNPRSPRPHRTGPHDAVRRKGLFDRMKYITSSILSTQRRQKGKQPSCHFALNDDPTHPPIGVERTVWRGLSHPGGGRFCLKLLRRYAD